MPGRATGLRHLTGRDGEAKWLAAPCLAAMVDIMCGAKRPRDPGTGDHAVRPMMVVMGQARGTHQHEKRATQRHALTCMQRCADMYKLTRE